MICLDVYAAANWIQYIANESQIIYKIKSIRTALISVYVCEAIGLKATLARGLHY